jgi:hypothetical protein
VDKPNVLDLFGHEKYMKSQVSTVEYVGVGALVFLMLICFTGYTVIQGYTRVRNQQNRFRRTLPSTWIKDQNAGFHFCSFLGTRLSTVFLKAGSGHPHRWGFDPHDQQQLYHVMDM